MYTGLNQMDTCAGYVPRNDSAHEQEADAVLDASPGAAAHLPLLTSMPYQQPAATDPFLLQAAACVPALGITCLHAA